MEAQQYRSEFHPSSDAEMKRWQNEARDEQMLDHREHNISHPPPMEILSRRIERGFDASVPSQVEFP